jgi:hypothetical protein
LARPLHQDALTKLAELHEKGSSEGALWKDPRLTEAMSLSSSIEMLRLPITLVLSALAVIFILPGLIFIVGVKASFSVEEFIKQTLRRAFTAIHTGADSLTSRG